MNIFGKFKIRKFYGNEITEEMLFDLREVANSGFGKPVPSKENENVAKKSDRLFVAYYKNRKVAFASVKIVHKNLGYLVGGVVNADFKNSGLYRELTKRRIEELKGRASYVSTRTQNPTVYYVLRHMVREIFPNEGIVPSKIVGLAKSVDRRVDNKLKVSWCYGRRLSSFDFPTKDEKANKLFSHLNLEHGDAYIIIGLL